MGRAIPPKLRLPRGIEAPPHTWLAEPGRVHTTNSISSVSAVLAQLIVMSNRHTHRPRYICSNQPHFCTKNGSPCSITERMVPELIPVRCSQPAGDVSHKPGSRLPLLCAMPAVTSATLKWAATNFAAWWTEAQWVWTVCLRLLPDSVTTAIWTQAVLRLSPAR